LVQNFAGLAVCGLLLGLFEGGLFPGLAVYLTLFYTKKELGFRIGYLFVCSALSGSVGGLLAFGIGYMDGIAGLRGWRWIFIIEGIPTFLTGIAAYFLLADTPETAYYLTPEERQLAQSRIDRQSGFTKASQQFRREDALTAITDWKVGVFCVCQLAGGTMLYGFSTFLPTIIKALGKWTVPRTQALTVPVYALGAITYVIVAYFSDRQQMRGPYVVAFAIVSVIGYGILLSNSGSGVHYFGCYVVACGLYVVLGIPLSWLPTRESNQHPFPTLHQLPNTSK
jgi:sugar phosphate permease